MGDRGPHSRGAAAHGPVTVRRFRRRAVTVVPAVAGVAALLFLAGALSLVGPRPRPAAPAAALVVGGPGRPPAGADLPSTIASLQHRLDEVPSDYGAWATLGLAYVEQARVSGDPTYYPRAEGALRRSLNIETDDNYAAYAGMAALASARHDFSGARSFARQGLTVNPANATLWGLLGDAETQLGDYDAAFEAVQRMVDLRPDTSSLARASYTWELRGNVAEATAIMQRALDQAPTPADRAFARYYLGELAFNTGDPAAALAHYQAGIDADPSYARLLEGRAKARAALGQVEGALADYAAVVERLPEPAYLLQYGELLESLGRAEEAQAQYGIFGSVARLFETSGVALDVDAVLFEADHGSAEAALRAAESAIGHRRFVDMADAYAWALHVNGRHADARRWSDEALELGTRNALFHYHAGLISRSLGDEGGARRHLAEALAINPHFSPLLAPRAREALV